MCEGHAETFFFLQILWYELARQPTCEIQMEHFVKLILPAAIDDNLPFRCENVVEPVILLSTYGFGLKIYKHVTFQFNFLFNEFFLLTSSSVRNCKLDLFKLYQTLVMFSSTWFSVAWIRDWSEVQMCLDRKGKNTWISIGMHNVSDFLIKINNWRFSTALTGLFKRVCSSNC